MTVHFSFMCNSVFQTTYIMQTDVLFSGWEGGDEWLRGQFKHYLLAMLATSKKNGKSLKLIFSIKFIIDGCFAVFMQSSCK